MKHFSESELLDAAEGRLAGDRQRHAGECVACARQVDDLRTVLARAVDAEVPEPSPLFWDHLSARVREEIAHEAPSRWGWASGLRPWPVAATVAAVAIALLVMVGVFRSTSNSPIPGRIGGTSPSLVQTRTFPQSPTWSQTTSKATRRGLSSERSRTTSYGMT